jgi:cytochrome c oxidase cbb3-type subunit III
MYLHLRFPIRWPNRKNIMQKTLSLLTVGLVCVGVSLSAQRRGGGPPQGPANPFQGQPQAIQEGREIYNEKCTTCHGFDGGAGEMGPALGLEGRRYALASPSEIFGAIKNGVPTTGMPPTQDLSDDQIWKVTAYIQALRGTAIDAPAPGNVALGEEIFWGKAECGKCHMVRGKGGVIGPELTAIADIRKTASIVDAMSNEKYRVQGDGGAIPRKLEPPNDYRAVRVTLPDGKVVRGVLKNENSTSLQILGVDDSRLHLLNRATVRDVVYEKTRLMPSDYETRLTKQEFQDLVAFLTRQSRREVAQTPK